MEYEDYFLNGRLIMKPDTQVGWFEGSYRGTLPIETDGQALMIPDVPPAAAERIQHGDESALNLVLQPVSENEFRGREDRILHIATKIGKSKYRYIPIATVVTEVNPPVGMVIPEVMRRNSEKHNQQRYI
jgi:hypothetical protein